MAGKSELDIEISPAGEVKVHIRGIKGKGCLELMKKIEKELGSVSERKPTSEYYEQPEEARIRRSV
jgi:hypothetical protein